MKNSIVFSAKGITAGASVMPKPVKAYCTAWEKTETLNEGLYAFPSGSKFVTYQVTAGETVADGKRAERQAKRDVNAPVKVKKAPAKVLQLANAFANLSATDKLSLASLLKG